MEEISADHPWEESRGIGESYGFNRAENIDDYNTSAELLHELISIVSRGGNLLLNVGPTADGRIPVIMQQRLIDIGEWLNTNGEAIYGSKAWNNAPENSEFYFTRKGNDLYVISESWPVSGFFVEGNFNQPADAFLLGNKEPLSVKKESNGLKITFPEEVIQTRKCQDAYVFRVEDILP